MIKDYEFKDLLMSMFSELNEEANNNNRDYWEELFQVDYECPDNTKKQILVNMIEYFKESGNFENNKYRITFERIWEGDEDYNKTITL